MKVVFNKYNYIQGRSCLEVNTNGIVSYYNSVIENWLAILLNNMELIPMKSKILVLLFPVSVI